MPIKVDANGEAWVPLPDAFVAKAKALAASGNHASARKVLAGCCEVRGKLF